MPFINGIRQSRERIVARTDEDRQDFLRKHGFSKAEAGRIIDTVLTEEGRKPESIFDYRYEDFEIVGYQSHPAIKAPVAV